MTRIIRLLKVIPLSICIIMLTGCWNYKEIDKLAIVAGAAIDKEDDQFLLTAEVVKTKGEKDSKPESLKIEGRGKTIFDATRNINKVSGKRLYWSHAKVIIISQEVAREGIIPAIDLFNRDH